VSAWHAATAALLAPKTGEEEPAELTPNDVPAERSLFECAGVGLGKEETYRVYASLLSLQQTKALATVRFFGKVLGTEKDYYVAEATYTDPPAPPEEEPPAPPGAPPEEPGVGCNTFVYFVANDPAGEWTVLPDVTPHMIVSSKPIHKYLTGDLSADVRAYPPFPGKEKEYLRTLIARIAQATTLTASSMFVMEAEAEAGAMPMPNESEEYAPPPASAVQWCTRYYGILDIGRTTNLPPPDDEEEAAALPKPQDLITPLTAVSEDEWSTAVYTHGGPPVAVARSAAWPGAYCAYSLAGKAATVASLYIGYGTPALKSQFVMMAPPPFQMEPEELVEQADMPLEEENAAFLEAETAKLAEEAANMEDPPEE